LSNGKQDDINNNWFIGQPIEVIYNFQGAGIWHLEDSAAYRQFNANGTSFTAGSARPVDINDDKKIDPNRDRTIIGNTRPRWIVGMTNTVTYKSLEFSIFLYGRLKYLYNTGGEAQTARGTQRAISYYNENNMNSDYQKPIHTEATGDPYSVVLGFKDASFIKIRNISLGYSLTGNALKKTGLSNLKAYVQIANPGMVFSNIDWLDMDVVTVTPAFNGATFNRGITFGLNATF
jgi:hypothetical protein